VEVVRCAAEAQHVRPSDGGWDLSGDSTSDHSSPKRAQARPPLIEGFLDDMDFVDGPALVVRALLTIVPEPEGGHPVSADIAFRPNHNFGGPEDRHFYIGQVDFDGGDLLPGETREVSVRFLPVRSLPDKLVVGRKWRVQVGTKLLGMAEVTQVQ
jgi:hypothetical protein